MLYKVRDLSMQIFLHQYIIHYLNHTLTMLASYHQNISTINHLYILQKKALRIIIFKECNVHSSPLFHHSKIIKIADKVKIEKYLFINKYTNNKLPLVFTNWFTFSLMSHSYQTLFTSKGNLQISSVQTTSYGKNAFIHMITKTWNDVQKEMKGVVLNTFSLN